MHDGELSKIPANIYWQYQILAACDLPPVTLNSENEDSDGSYDSVLEDSIIIGYNFEPDPSSESCEDNREIEPLTDEVEENNDVVVCITTTLSRLDNKDWCKCENCSLRYQEMECVYCSELEKPRKILDKNNLSKESYTAVLSYSQFHAPFYNNNKKSVILCFLDRPPCV